MEDRFLLTPDELHDLTDYKLPKLQIVWLREHGWVFEIGGDDKPKVARAYANQKMGYKLGRQRQPQPEPEWEPDFTDLRNGTASV